LKKNYANRFSGKEGQSDLKNELPRLMDDQEEMSSIHYLEMEIRIIDSGCGIAAENLEKLFMNFSKLEDHSSMNHMGNGLGLSICKSLIELMGGSVKVESEVGKGTSFIISLKTKCRVR
jgi:signal transduction histidine kinase